ncbi:hypothetical protein B0H13DRAFT_1889488 [Mycena leptocephala]|nr:hypothetical protein B0H13DRAFT_1889488 [Mycena leptocephala]
MSHRYMQSAVPAGMEMWMYLGWKKKDGGQDLWRTLALNFAIRDMEWKRGEGQIHAQAQLHHDEEMHPRVRGFLTRITIGRHAGAGKDNYGSSRRKLKYCLTIEKRIGGIGTKARRRYVGFAAYR